MGRRPQTPEGIEFEYIPATRKGNCPDCGKWGEVTRQLPVYVDVARRKPDGRLYSMDEMREAVEDFGQRWGNGRYRHHMCALEAADRVDGFNVSTGQIDEVAAFRPTFAEAS